MKKSASKKQKHNNGPARKKPLSLYELSKDLCGSISGPPDMSRRKLVGYGSDSFKVFTRSISHMRQQIAALWEELEDLDDSLDLAEARMRDAGKPRTSLAEIKKRYGLK
jgi:hypothetical protein